MKIGKLAKQLLITLGASFVLTNPTWAAAPTTIQGANQQDVRINGSVVNLGTNTAGGAEVQVSVGAVHAGSTIGSTNTQTVTVTAGDGDTPAILNVGTGSGGENVCANTMIGSIGSTSCMD